LPRATANPAFTDAIISAPLSTPTTPKSRLPSAEITAFASCPTTTTTSSQTGAIASNAAATSGLASGESGGHDKNCLGWRIRIDRPAAKSTPMSFTSAIAHSKVDRITGFAGSTG
jgi:hypothetical protein